MKTTNKILLSSALALAVAGISDTKAADKKKVEKEKCFGVTKAGKNDCGVKDVSSCMGTSKIDGDKGAWIYLKKGICEKLVGGSLTIGKNEEEDS
ncbi:MAG TPA: hypothetical protein DD412_07180 [Holosporales bacterium]|nr:hypothetical protein [Holosporales bacterium]